ncbi:MAG: ABC transporter permease [Methylococcales bacterium]|nr:ABC transporter permease [Methylococcales bacterium]
MKNLLCVLWDYRGFVLGSVKREFQSKYRNSMLGAAWTVINPLAMIVVYTVIFSQVMRAKLPGIDTTFAYSIYLCAGILTWELFSEIVDRAQSVFIDNANLLKKVSFPRLCLPIIVVANAVLNFSIIFTLFSLFLIVSDNFPGWNYFAIFPVLLINIIFAIGLGITLGILNVFFRDIGQLSTIILKFWFWLTPIVYPISIIPQQLRTFVDLNPMVNIISAYQTILVKGELPQWQELWVVSALSLLLCIIGLTLFRKHAGDMVDEL